MNAAPILILLFGLAVMLLLVHPDTRAVGIKVLGGLALVVLLFSSIFFVQTRYREQSLQQDGTQAQSAGERVVRDHFAHDHVGAHKVEQHAPPWAAAGGAAQARPAVNGSVKLVFIIGALGVAMLLAREKSRSVGIKIVGGVALLAVLVVGGYFWASVPSVENHREWNRRHGQSHGTPGHDAQDHIAEQHSAEVLETPPTIALPENATIAQQPLVVGEGRPPEPADEIILEREPEAAPLAAAPARPTVPTNPTAPVTIAPQDPQPQKSAESPTVDAERPAWVDQPPRREGDVYIVVANSGPFVTERECTEALYGEAQKVARRVIDDLIGPGTADVVQSDQEYVRRLIDRVCKQQYDETRSTSVGPMKIMHVRMEFDDQVRADLKQRWRQAQLAVRLRRVSGGALWVLALVGAAYSFLKFDTATKGYYTKRLQVAAVVVILTIVVLGFSVAFHRVL